MLNLYLVPEIDLLENKWYTPFQPRSRLRYDATMSHDILESLYQPLEMSLV
jgi:hypothetical protein